MAPRRRYEIVRGKAAVFSWLGCSVSVEGDCHAYVAEETPMISYLNVHNVLEARRRLIVSFMLLNWELGELWMVCGWLL